MDQGCSDVLVDCLCLQRDVHDIKRCQGTPSSMRLWISAFQIIRCPGQLISGVLGLPSCVGVHGT